MYFFNFLKQNLTSTPSKLLLPPLGDRLISVVQVGNNGGRSVFHRPQSSHFWHLHYRIIEAPLLLPVRLCAAGKAGGLSAPRQAEIETSAHRSVLRGQRLRKMLSDSWRGAGNRMQREIREASLISLAYSRKHPPFCVDLRPSP